MTNPDKFGENNSDQNPQHAAEDAMGSSSFGNSDFGNSDFGNSDFGKSDFGQSDFGASSFGASDSSEASSFGGAHSTGSEETVNFGETSSDFGQSDFNQASFNSSDNVQGFGSENAQAASASAEPASSALGSHSHSADNAGSANGVNNTGNNNAGNGFGQSSFGQPVPPAGNFNQGGFNQQFQSQNQPQGQPGQQNQQGFGGFQPQGQPGQQNQQGYNPQMQGFNQYPQAPKDNFFKSLFDFKFSSFITVKFASIIYVIAVVVGVLSWIGGLIVAVTGGSLTGIMGDLAGSSSAGGGMAAVMILGHLIFGTLGLLIYLIQVRLVLEFFVSNIQTTENTKKLVELAEEDK